MKNHPDRVELLHAIGVEPKEISSHLKKCQDCSEIYDALKMFPFAGKSELIDAPDILIRKAIAIMDSGSSVLAGIKSTLIEVVFDSWENLALHSVRNSVVLDERRLQFKTGDILFDLRAEKEKSVWNFTAQITKDSKPEAITVVVGSKEYEVNEFGIIQWSSKRPPQQITLKDKDTTIELPGINRKLS